MTDRHTGAHGDGTTVRVRAEGDVTEEDLAYLREKADAALRRPGLPPVSGEVRITRATAAHTDLPWSAAAEVRVGGDRVVVHAHEASARELADRLHDRLPGQVDRAAHRREDTRRTAAPPPWRGGPR
ncbi:hypothetical protein ACLGIH_03800 [Streptomyces sp. HMX87]|uniref:hypothetical protein n=1 Tax=Streptomyces sp. HMX87 TaxID=3390849 RepID=UPI003A86D050